MGLIAWLKRRKMIAFLFIFTYIASGLVVNLLELCTSPLYLLNKRLYRIINAKLVYLQWCVVPFALKSWASCDIRGFVDPEVVNKYCNKEHALCVLNHSGDVDWMVGWCLIDQMCMLGGVKAIMKDVAKCIPGIGWTFVAMEYPFLKRDWTSDEKRLERACINLKDYPVNMLLCLFAEGTRFTKEKHKKSVEFAKSRGLPELKYHLIPRTKGFSLILKNMKDTIPAVYDITLCYRGDGPTPSLMGVVNADHFACDVALRRIPTADIPMDSEKAIADWLINLYVEKDKLVEYHKEHGTFPGEVVHLPERVLPSVIVCVWLVLLAIPALLGTLYLLWAGAWSIVVLIAIAIFLVEQLFMYIARHTETKHGSSQGLQSVENGSRRKTD